MRLHKAEIFFILLIALIGLASLSSYFAWQSAIGLSLVDKNVIPILQYSYLSMVLTSLCIACGVLLIYPTIKIGVVERGRLRQMAENLSVRSESLEQAAVTDSITGLHNRRYFDDALREYLEAFQRIGKPVGMMILDLDHFKVINDTYGHDVGDEVLRVVSKCLAEFTRHHDVVARIGGEEFAVLSPNIGEKQLFDFANRIRSAVADLKVKSGDVIVKVTVSAGIAVWDGKESGEKLYQRTDRQLYAAKHSGRNRVCPV